MYQQDFEKQPIGVVGIGASAGGFEARGEYHFQAILMDLMMPVKSGVDAAKEIRSLPMRDAEDIPIIALSADVTEDALARTKNAGMNTLVAKPIDRDKLFSFLAKAFEK